MAARTQSSKRGTDLTVHEAVKELRARLDQSQQRFSSDANISIATLNHYERDWVPPLGLLLKFREMARDRDHADLETVFDREYQEKLQGTMKDTSINYVGFNLQKAWGEIHITFTSLAERNRAEQLWKAFNTWRYSNKGAAEIRDSLEAAASKQPKRKAS